MPDMYQALDKGVFDGAAVPWEAIHAFRLYEVAKNVTMVPFYASYFSLCANRQKIQSLPKDVRDILMSKGGLEGSKFWGKNFFDTRRERRRGARQGRGHHAEPLRRAARGGRALEEDRRRAAVGRLGEEDGGQGPQGGPRRSSIRRSSLQSSSDLMRRGAAPVGRAAGAGLCGRRGEFVTQVLGRWLLRIEAALLYVSVLATFGMMCLTSADAFSRYLFNKPILGALEITEKYLMVAAIFLGLSYAYRGGLFIRVTLLVDQLSGKCAARRRLFRAPDHARLLRASWCYATGQQAIRGLSDDTELSTLPLLVGPAYSFVLVGFLALTVILLIDLARVRRGQSMLLSQEAPSAT